MLQFFKIIILKKTTMWYQTVIRINMLILVSPKINRQKKTVINSS